jgi:hypothetical protein
MGKPKTKTVGKLKINIIMAQMILKGKEMIRINPTTKTKIEFSTNDGRSWIPRSTSASYGNFSDLTDNGKEILGITSKGLYFSTNAGISWIKRG